jgi:hypothetical protein
MGPLGGEVRVGRPFGALRLSPERGQATININTRHRLVKGGAHESAAFYQSCYKWNERFAER